MTELEIWAPRYSTNDCCVLASKVTSDSETYKIWFSKAAHLKGNQYVLTGRELRDAGVVEMTKTDHKMVYAIPMDVLEKFKVEEVL